MSRFSSARVTKVSARGRSSVCWCECDHFFLRSQSGREERRSLVRVSSTTIQKHVVVDRKLDHANRAHCSSKLLTMCYFGIIVYWQNLPNLIGLGIMYVVEVVWVREKKVLERREKKM